MADDKPQTDPKPGVYDHPSTDAAEVANAAHTEAWAKAQKKEHHK